MLSANAFRIFNHITLNDINKLPFYAKLLQYSLNRPSSVTIIFLLILGVNIQGQQQQPVTDTIRRNPAVSSVMVAEENATSASLISTKPSQIVQAVSMIELQFHMHVV